MELKDMKDLRIGNLLKLKEKKEIILIKGLYFDQIGYEQSKGLEWIAISKLEPIDFKAEHYLDILNFKLRIDGERCNEQLVFIKIIDNKFCLWDYDAENEYNRNIFNTEIHLLQNQYYFLTGDELDVSKIK